MRKKTLLLPVAGIALVSLLLLKRTTQTPVIGLSDVAYTEKDLNEEEDGYDGAASRDEFEFERIKDPSLGYVPGERMIRALEANHSARLGGRVQSPLTWTERGPSYDSVGPSGNSRPGSAYTSGRIRGVLIDTLRDITGNTVFAGGVAGGLWKCTNFMSAAVPNWTHADDRFDNLAVSSICQDPSAPVRLYFSTGEPTSNADAVYGAGIWKSENGGDSWNRLPSSIGFQRAFKIVCDAAGNIYVANRSSNLAGSFASGLYRSKDGGSTWQNITPSGLTASNSICTDIEFSSNGRMHASFGYAGTRVQHLYTNDPANVSNGSWTASGGIRLSTASAYRLELATQGNVMYGVTVAANNLDSAYKSVDGGATWTKQNTSAYPSGVLNGQGWYNLTLAINPDNSNEFIVGGLDAYRFGSSGTAAPTRMTYWVGTAPYVHADHHFIQWWKAGTQSRMVIGCDGGLFLSNNGGTSFTDRNRNLNIKQFYSAAIHPNAGSPVLLAGAQDNGVHRLTNPGLSYSHEVYGGDGCFVHINQQDPNIQFGSYVYNTYRISTDGGNTWRSQSLGDNGYFVNPFDYDDALNILYASNATTPASQINRWANAHANGTNTVLTIAALTRGSAGNATAFKVSNHTRDRVFIGGSNGKVVRLDNASTVTTGNVNASVTDVSGTQLPNAYVSCVNTGNTDDVLVATFSNYGVQHVWYSVNGGGNWTNISGNLPDIPVRWALIDPQDNSKMYLATEAGIYYTEAISGAATSWTNDVNFPMVRTDMLKLRLSDNTIVAATHGRGLFTAQLPSAPEVRFSSRYANYTESSTGTVDCRPYKEYTYSVGITSAPTGDAVATYSIEAGSAIQGVDYDFTANGSFTSPTNQHIFASGATTPKTLTVRIYDDAEVEPTEFFRVSFTVSGYLSGTTNAMQGAYNKMELTLQDNDKNPVVPGAGAATVGDGSYGGYIQPLRSGYEKARSQYIYLATELRAAGFGAGNITSLGLNVTSKTSLISFSGFRIALKHTTASSFTTTTFEDGAQTCYSANYSSFVGLNTFTFTTPFNWDGVSNILVEFCYDNTSIPGGGGDNVMSSATPDMKGIWNRAATGTGCSLAAQYTNVGGTYLRPDVRLNGQLAGNPTETALGATRTQTFTHGGGMVHYYTPSGKILASLKNPGGINYGCTEVSIDRAGTTALPFNESTAATFVASKTYKVVPATNFPNGQYQITLYYTEAEKVGWEAATGKLWDSVRIIKVKSAISNYTVATPNPDGTPVEVVRPVHGRFGNDYTLTYTFGTGFSGFGVGIVNTCSASAPVITTQPSSQAVCNTAPATFTVSATGTGLQYQWWHGSSLIPGATSASYTVPGTTALTIGSYSVTVTNSCGVVTSAVAQLTLDNSPGCTTAAPTRDADISDATLMPNRIQSQSLLRVRSRRAMRIDWQVVDGRGRTVLRFNQSVSAGVNDLPVQFGRLAAGTYLLVGTTAKGNAGTLRFVKY
ncbi:hypothetical protein [Flaviaesturariibacter amylovorans]|uniref:Ig-like domain-containing protein n=1 Tax=Flaviaesturariibacter amylovorans TaxID=1084520 RepID=A0ABP8GRV2_9BACT